MTNQEVLNYLIGVILALGGWVLRELWDAIKALQKENRDLAEKLNNVEVIVAGDYVKKSYFESKVDALFDKLDDIRDRLEKKVDK